MRFHAVYWPAMLLSAGLPLPTDILVHDYLTVDGHKISKSARTSVDPVALVGDFGTDAVRWWLLRDVPRVGDADFTVPRLLTRADDDLAGGVGNLVHRVVTMVHKYGVVPSDDPGELEDACTRASQRAGAALEDFDFRRATGAVLGIVEEANRYIERVRPWELAKTGRPADVQSALGTLLYACRALGAELGPFVPDLAARVTKQCTAVDGALPAPRPLIKRLAPPPVREPKPVAQPVR